MSADRNSLSVIGIGGGAYMATIMHVAHSSEIKGVGLISGGPYSYGFTGSPWGSPSDASTLSNIYTGITDSESVLDPTSNLNGAPVYIISGDTDTVFPPALQAATETFYTDYGATVSH